MWPIVISVNEVERLITLRLVSFNLSLFPTDHGRIYQMDFVTSLPWSNGNDAIWVVVDQLTKMRHLIPWYTTIDAPSLANLLLDNI